ncbi:ABC transporter ATP-binding protein [Raineyella sp. LH-20]|uniref:ABC transporter ATP-binding protein n=1 Tax=Raineyella sp. LH-20 TaxID=3081204 RepID=UPI0029552693|nr:ABC transporter ATP-binding protein [Raineyella sp. LH-20]WOP18245.1 ABC transporter ATP-binding protein [Raineyella sp. LH-20]
MNTEQTVIDIEGLRKRRGEFVLGPVDLAVRRGYVTALVGVNGAGKTTLLRTLLGLVHADAGTVRIPEPARIGVAFDHPFLVPDWTVRQASDAVRGFRPGWDDVRFTALCERFRLRTEEKVKELSRGESGKLMVALALAHRPDLLILDEPTSGLDPAARADLIDVLREHMAEDEGHSLLFSTHIIADLEGFADDLVLIDAGRVTYAGPADELTETYAVIRGGADELTPETAALVHGLRRSPEGFTGIVRLAESAAFDRRVVLEQPTLDQVVVGLGRHDPQES